MADIFGMNIKTDLPNLPLQELDPATKAMIEQQREQAMQPTSEIAAPMTAGIEERLGQVGLAPGLQAQTGVSPGMIKAIENIHAGQTQDVLKNLKYGSQMRAEVEKANRLKQAASYAMTQQQTKLNHYQALTDAYGQMEAQRAQFVASLTGLASYGMGSFMGSQSKRVMPNASPDQMMSSSALMARQEPGYYLGSNIGEQAAKSPYTLGEFDFGGME